MPQAERVPWGTWMCDMNPRDGEIILQNDRSVVVRGHLTEAEMQRLTGWSGSARHTWWRHAYTPWRQRQLMPTPRGRFVEARKKGRGAFAVTILIIRR